MLLFLSAEHNNVGLNFPVGVGRCSAVTPLAADLVELVKLELWVGRLISSLCLILAFEKSPDRVENFCRKSSLGASPPFFLPLKKIAERVGLEPR